jgi:DNA-binding MarR family transcriptional regulator
MDGYCDAPLDARLVASRQGRGTFHATVQHPDAALYRGQCGISDIGDRFEISAAAASQHVENLVQAGLIERTEDAGDRRVRQIQLSGKGRDLLEKGISERYHWMDRLKDNLDEEAREKISAALVALTEAARKLDQN